MAPPPATGASASPRASVAVASAGGNKITFSKTSVPGLPPVVPVASTSAMIPPPLPPASKAVKRPPLAPEDAPITRNATRRASSSDDSTARPAYREPSSESGSGISDGDPPGFRGAAPVAFNSKGKGALKVERKYEELEDIIFSNPKSFTAMVFAIAEARGTTLFVSDDRTTKQSSAYMHITCAHRRTGCPFILKLTRAKEGGWILKAAHPQAGEADVKARSNYNCVHRPGSVADAAPALTQQGTAVKVPPSVRAGHSMSPAVGSPLPTASTFELPSAASTSKGRGKKKGPAPKKGAAAQKESPAGSPAPFDQQIEPVSGKSVPSREARTASVKERSSMASPQVLGNMAKVKATPDEDRALAPPFARSLSLQAKIQPVLSYERYNTPHGEPTGLNARAQAFVPVPAIAPNLPLPAPAHHQLREQPHGPVSAPRPMVIDPRPHYQVPPPAPAPHHQPAAPYSAFGAQQQSVASTSAAQTHPPPPAQIHPPPPTHHLPSHQYVAGPYQPSYRHILVANPASAPSAPRASLLPASSSLSAWTHFFKALDPTLVGFAAVLAAPTMALSPESFFAESMEMRLALIDVLEVEQVGVWPRLKLKMKIKEKGEEVWKEVVEKETKRVEAKRAEQLAAKAAEEQQRAKVRHLLESRTAEKEPVPPRRHSSLPPPPSPMKGVEQHPAAPVAVEEVVMKETTIVEAPPVAAPAPVVEPPKKVVPSPQEPAPKEVAPAEEERMVVDPPPAAAPEPVVEEEPVPVVVEEDEVVEKPASKAKGTKSKPKRPKKKSTASTAASSSPIVAEVPVVSSPVVSTSQASPIAPAPTIPAPSPVAAKSPSPPPPPAPASRSPSLSGDTASVYKIPTPFVPSPLTNPTSAAIDERVPTSPLSSAMDISSDEDETPLIQKSAEIKKIAVAAAFAAAAAAAADREAKGAKEDVSEQALIRPVMAWLNSVSNNDMKMRGVEKLQKGWLRDMSLEDRRELKQQVDELSRAQKALEEAANDPDEAHGGRQKGCIIEVGGCMLKLEKHLRLESKDLGVLVLSDDEDESKGKNKAEATEDGDTYTRDTSPEELLITNVSRPSAVVPPPPPPASSSHPRTTSNSYAPPPPPRPSSGGRTISHSTLGGPMKSGPASPEDARRSAENAARPNPPPPAPVTAKRARSPTPPPVYPDLSKDSSANRQQQQPPQESAGDKVRRELAARHAANNSAGGAPPKSSPRAPAGVPIPRPTGPPAERTKPAEPTPPQRESSARPSSYVSAVTATPTPRASYNPSGAGLNSSIRIGPFASASSSAPRSNNDSSRRSGSFYGTDDGYGGIPGLSPPLSRGPGSNGAGGANGANGPRYASPNVAGVGSSRGPQGDCWAGEQHGSAAKRRRDD